MRIIIILLLAAITLRGPSLITNMGINVGYVWLNHAVVTANPKAQKMALRIFEQTAENAKQPHSAVWRAMGHIHAMQHNEQEAITMWLIANNEKDMVGELLSWGVINEQAGNRQNALRWYQRATMLAPHVADAWYFAGRIFEAEGDTDSAYLYYQTSLKTAQFNRVGISDIAFRLGALAHTEARWLEALEWFNLALAEPDFRASDRAWHAHYLRGDVWRLMNQPELASLDYQWTINLNPNHYWARVYLAQILWLLEADFDEADTLLLQAIAIAPTQKWAYRVRGDLFRDSYHINDAIEMYRLVLTIDPQDRLAQHYLEELQNDAK